MLWDAKISFLQILMSIDSVKVRMLGVKFMIDLHVAASKESQLLILLIWATPLTPAVMNHRGASAQKV